LFPNRASAREKFQKKKYSEGLCDMAVDIVGGAAVGVMIREQSAPSVLKPLTKTTAGYVNKLKRGISATCVPSGGLGNVVLKSAISAFNDVCKSLGLKMTDRGINIVCLNTLQNLDGEQKIKIVISIIIYWLKKQNLNLLPGIVAAAFNVERSGPVTRSRSGLLTDTRSDDSLFSQARNAVISHVNRMLEHSIPGFLQKLYNWAC